MLDPEFELTTPPLRPPLQNTSAPRDGEIMVDLTKLKKWQEERIARRLRGEYESAVLHLAEVINANIETHMRLAAVRVEGTPHTRASFLGSLVQPYLAKPNPDQQTLASVMHDARAIGSLLQETDIFESVYAQVERCREPLAQHGDVELVFMTKERSRMYLKTATELGNNEAGASATCRIRNAFGGAEAIEAHLAFGTTTRIAYNASLTAPLTNDLKTRGELSLYGFERDNTPYCSAFEGVRGIRAVVRNGTLSRGLHELGYEGVLRHVGNLQPSASVSMRGAAGLSIKSAISHAWTCDTRDDSIFGTRGAYLRLAQELAGLGGDASFYKAEGHAQFVRPLVPGVSLSFAARSGLLWPLGKPVPFPDRFQLGGPTSVRMFRMNSMGPHDGPDSLGGDAYWSAGLSVISDIPRKPHWPVKLHGFLNAGRLDSVDHSKPLQQSLVSAFSKPSVSAGLGLVYRLQGIRVEMNFGLPLVAAQAEGARKGFQLGIGMEFL
ncbi:uncharacterized protein PHACADRAFT_208046 [Phanerochaete carnosa HHB-10118-sp]|uniref:Bacterial surface antigen (D15) domain-containing protein n=1 Tax=Phanerochaete carnosa (strain HHB-10118-sp) TaxID=650164 RepID=K5VZ87_PHACS|nr:uncharacterized protein PHACADRAFT_208046 [Phanerochaete carnosa HHB-10118-sp]EKM56873.1 hypothetical protein PHACADRAFT_208046 [Phanerochaete carnosa HHB-10118-sp]